MDLFDRMLELSGQGFYCAQILMILALESEEKEDPDLIRAMGGLNGGLGFSGRVCGALTGGCCFLSYFLGKGEAEELDLLAEAAAAPEELDWPVSERREWVWPAEETAEQPLPIQGELPQEGGEISPRELYAALGRTARVSRLAAEGAAGRAPAIVTVPAPVHEARQDWEDLDRAVQRDARRYDGGFALY